ncbi:MAG: hypothetical protein QOE90_2256 [Thermoplasmata archaeon]|nr:hypothetical protein [Thermoplasmata archaeon]
MSVQDKLRLHLANTAVEGTWLAHEGPLTAAGVIDAYNAARGSRITLVHEGPVGDVARRSAARFGITLLDAASFPQPQPQPAPQPEPRPAPLAAPTVLAEALAPALPAPAPEPLLPAHVEIAPEPAPLGPALPWDATVPPADPFATATVTLEVTPHEVLAMPWAMEPREDEEHHEVTRTPRGPRGVTVRPTTDLHPDAKHWGPPWPRPLPPADAVAVADPRVWNNPARLGSLHRTFEGETTRLSVPPPGAPPQEGAGWLKKLQADGVK